ncbi:MAG: C1 family peptidase [Pseudomonadota bacterium]
MNSQYSHRVTYGRPHRTGVLGLSKELLSELRRREKQAPSDSTPGDSYRRRPNWNLAGEPTVDLGKDFVGSWPAEFQGKRNTCVAFAVKSCLELQIARKSESNPKLLSAQFLYYHMRKSDPDQTPPGWCTGATKLGYARSVLAENGICVEADRTYDLDAEGDGPAPSPQAEAAAVKYPEGCYADYPSVDKRPTRGVARQVYDQLNTHQRPVAIALLMFKTNGGQTNWTFDDPTMTQDPWDSGIVRGPGEPKAVNIVGETVYESLEALGHAVCVIGFQQDPEEATGGWFIFRNSWGMDFANRFQSMGAVPRVPAAGFGAISATYVDNYCWEWFSPSVH